MPASPDFPHLRLTYQGTYEPLFHGGSRENPAIKANLADPQGHAGRIRDVLGRMRQSDQELRRLRAELGLPAIPADKGFLLKLPEGVDVEQLVRALGVELVAETEEGLMLVSSVDLQFDKLEEVLRQFETGGRGGGYGASLLDIIAQSDDERRLKNILAPDVFVLWPLADATTYTFDLGIQTATSTREVKWPPVKRKKNESEPEFLLRREQKRSKVWEAANIEWDENAEARVNELQQFIQHYGGT